MHLLIDGFGGDAEKMKSKDMVYHFLDTFPSKIEMNKISEPQVTVYHGPNPEDLGVSGFVMIAESHISVHTFPDRSYVNIDVFSCKDFDAPKVLSIIIEEFQLAKVKRWIIGRGLNYSTPPSSSSVSRGRAKATVLDGGK